MKTIAVTTGDIDGIGLEVTVGALLNLPVAKSFQYVVYKSSKTPLFLKKKMALVKKKYPESRLNFIEREDSPADWVYECGQLAYQNKISAIVNGPLSKTEIHRAGYSEVGHTEIYKRICRTKNVYMFFLGRHFHVALATGHLPVKDVAAHLTTKIIEDVLHKVNAFNNNLYGAKNRLPVYLVGMNPHAGEGGIIGSEELQILIPAIQRLSREKVKVLGPLVPDAAFLKKSWSTPAIYVCAYHDQGLIPFKMVHGHSGAHLTLGLPFIRTSVDHGTAKDIYGKNIADPTSMQDALIWAQRLCKGVK